MNIEILGRASDLRTNTLVIYAKISISDYLSLVGDNFAEFEIQRRREKHKAYERMKKDVLQGALLPAITLAVKLDKVDELLLVIEAEDESLLREALSVPGQVHILDGLQRTYILSDLSHDGAIFLSGQTVLVEFWLERDIRNLIYRIIVLNAGQKPMSMRHQVELLFMTVQDRLEREVPGLEIFKEREGNRRTKARKYALDRIASAYQCFITKTPEVQRENLVAQKLVEEDILASSEEELGEQFDNFKKYLIEYTLLDDEICRIYSRDQESDQEQDGNGQLPTGTSWFGSENVMNSFFAAVADFGSSATRLERVSIACNSLHSELQQSQRGQDPLGLSILQKIIQGFNTRKVNVGFATRKLLTAGFKEYFRDEGQTPLEKCWINEAE